MKVKIEEIKLNDSFQPRGKLDSASINDWSEKMEEGTIFPPVKLFSKKEGEYWVADGFHRISAAMKVGYYDIEAEVEEGGYRDAKLFSMQCNEDHGIPRTKGDRRRCVQALLEDSEWKNRSARWIAEHVNLAHTTVNRIIKELGEERDGPVEYKTKSGSTAEMPTTKKESKKETPPPDPPVEENSTTIKEPEAPAAPPPDKEDDSPYDSQGYLETADQSELVRFYRILTLLDTLTGEEWLDLAAVEGIDFAKEQIQETLDGAWVTHITTHEKNLTENANRRILDWIDGKLRLSGQSIHKKEPTKKELPPEAHKCVEAWKKLIGIPQSGEGKEYEYAKSFTLMHTADKLSWPDIQEIIQGAKQWVDKGIDIQSPLALRKPTSSGDRKKWEAIQQQFRSSPDYKPARAIPECPTCGAKLEKHDYKYNGELYNGYICKKHPKSSRPVGEAFLRPKKARKK